MSKPPARQTVAIDPLNDDPTVQEAAKSLDVSGQTVRRLIIAGDIDAYKYGGGTRVKRPSLRNYVERCRSTPIKLSPPAAPGTRGKGRPSKAQLEAADSAAE